MTPQTSPNIWPTWPTRTSISDIIDRENLVDTYARKVAEGYARESCIEALKKELVA